MPSPFLGMDPYLEGYLWADAHHRLANQISDQLAPVLRPRYVARIEIQVVNDTAPQGEIGIMYPDVEIVEARPHSLIPPPMPTSRRGDGGVLVVDAPAFTPETFTLSYPSVEVRVASVHILDAAQNQLITSIEILSPVNKHEPGLTKYRDKQSSLRTAGVHLLEIDLLRRGQRPLDDQRIPASDYRITLTRSYRSRVSFWTFSVQDPLPVLPVPLRPPDADVALDLGLAFRTIYERAAYDLSVNYNESPPPPALSEEAQAWWNQRRAEESASS